MSFNHRLLKEKQLTMIQIHVDDSECSSSDESCTPPFDFKLPTCRLPDFLDTARKWGDTVYATDTLSSWCDLQMKIESYSPLFLSEEESDTVVRSMAEDIIYIHGMTAFFPQGHCKDCGVVHSVSFWFISLLVCS